MIEGIQYDLFEAEWQMIDYILHLETGNQNEYLPIPLGMNDLLCPPYTASIVDKGLQSAKIPLREAEWERALNECPNREFAR